MPGYTPFSSVVCIGPFKNMPDSFPTVPCPEAVSGKVWVYILQSTDGSLYIGQTRDLRERIRKHRFGLGAKHTHDHAAPRLIFHEGPLEFAAAIRREAQLKRWSRAKKEALIRGNYDVLKTLSRSRTARPSQTRHQYPRPDPI